jgi:hypothetical protein
MSTLREDASHTDHVAVKVGTNQLSELVSDKAWDVLGLTGQEFLRAWYAREFVGDLRPSIVALDRLMRTGRWVQTG